jgi:hypothetical protein
VIQSRSMRMAAHVARIEKRKRYIDVSVGRQLRIHYMGIILKWIFYKWGQHSSILVQTLSPYSGDLKHCRSFTPTSEDGIIEGPKHVRQK